MIKFGRLNNLPESILKTIPKVAAGKKVSFSLPISKNRDGSLNWPVAVGIRDRDLISDPKTGDTYEIANIIRVNPGPKGEEAEIEAPFFYKQSAGRITLDPRIPEQRNLYQYLWLCNENESNPNRNPSVIPKYHLVDDVKDALDATNKMVERSMAVSSVFNMTDVDLFAYCGLVGIGVDRDIQVVRAEALSVAEKNPARFHELSKYLKEMGPYVKVVSDAIDRGIIYLDKSSFAWKWKDNKMEFYTGMSTMTDMDNKKRLAEWLRNDKEGKSIHLNLIESLGKAQGA